MGYNVTATDYDALPAEMLPFAKQHMRVDFTDDDATITRYLRWAIGQAEQVIDCRVNPVDVAWTPPLESGLSRYQFPLQPVLSFVVKAADGTDISAGFEIVGGSFTDPVWLSHSDGTPFPADCTITFKAGVATSDDLMPNIEASVYRIAATLYENRESISTLSLEAMPGWLNDLLVGTWLPRA